MHPRTEVIQSGKVRNLDVTESLTYQGTAFVPSAATDEKSKVSSNDTTAGYLNGKLVAGANVTLTENNNGGNETLTIAANFTDADDKVKVSAADTTPAFLDTKLLAGSNITLTKGNVGGNETYTVAANVPVTSVNTQTGAVNLTAANVGAAATVHTHAASDIVSGVIATARLASTGVASATTFLRGDQSWAAAPVTSVNTQTGAVVLTNTDVGAAATVHTHAASDIVSGVIATARLASSGTADATTFLRGDQTWATPPGLTGFIATQNTAAPNNTVNASRLLVDATSANADFVLQAKGTGSILAQLPDGTTTGGNKRGDRAIDFGFLRGAASQVASGSSAQILGGVTNTASGGYSIVVGGSSNTASGNYGFVGSGSSNTNTGVYGAAVSGANHSITANYGIVVGGNTNSVAGEYSSVLGGSNNSVGSGRTRCVVVNGTSCTITGGSGSNNFIGNGSSCNIQGDYASVLNGQNNLCYGQYTTVLGGAGNTVNPQHSLVYGNNNNLASSTNGRSIVLGFTNNVTTGVTDTFTVGTGHTNSGYYSAILGGQSNNTNGNSYQVVVGGRNNRGWGTDSIALGGNFNYAMHDGSIAMGKNSLSTANYTRVFSASQFVNQGDAQLVETILQRSTTDSTPTELSITGGNPAGGASIKFVVPTDTSISFDLLITARRTDVDNESAAWSIRGLITNEAGTTALTAAPLSTQIAASAGAATWQVNVTADNVNDRLAVFVTGENLKTIYWVAHVRAVMVTG